ncbi:MAG: NAD(P)/FAD-dependent oxidoreductase [Rhodocyclaceae bacterium]|nr:NAD(P)/FAD-dependent oxidoreductase [Rhodocyclaceae bacterium]
MDKTDAIVVGAGLAGLNCARELVRQGRSVRLLEAAATAGGRIGTELHQGYRLDRGFQVLQTAYPEARSALDLSALDLRAFVPGALIRFEGRFHRIADPWRQPLAALGTLFSPVGTLADKWRMALLRRQVMSASIDQIYARPETTAAARLRELGFSDASVDRFFRPFLAGVFFDPALSVSSRAFEFCFRAFAAGDTAVPATGMGAIPAQLLAGLPADTLRTGARVTGLSAGGVTLDTGERVLARAVVVATDGVATARLLGDEPVPAMRGTTCLYFAAATPPIDEPILVLNATGHGPVNSLVVPTLLSRDYAPAGDSLIAINVPGIPAQDDAALEAAVRDQMRGWFGAAVGSWRHLKTFRLPAALPLQTAPVENPRYRDPRRTDWLYVCGEYCNAPTINWALYSGRRAAEALVAASAPRRAIAR